MADGAVPVVDGRRRLDPDLAPVAAATADELRLTRSQLETRRGVRAVFEHGPPVRRGRLCCSGYGTAIDYEGQAAIELRGAGAGGLSTGTQPALPLAVRPDGVIDPAPMVQAMVAALHAGTPVPILAAAFHQAVAVAVAEVVTQVAAGTTLVGLTGGVFQNVRCWARAVRGCGRTGLRFSPITPCRRTTGGWPWARPRSRC